ncbi:MAG TPA: hypothetical protein VF458_06800, partial [Ktedonobacteraceae bacterium]
LGWGQHSTEKGACLLRDGEGISLKHSNGTSEVAVDDASALLVTEQRLKFIDTWTCNMTRWNYKHKDREHIEK